MLSLGTNIKTARKKMGLTQEELASQIGVTSAAVSRWESGAGMPDISMIVPLAQVLEVSTDVLFGLTQTNQNEAQYMELRKSFEEIESNAETPSEAALQECKLLLKKCTSNPVNNIYACCFVERTANLSRHVDFEGFAKDAWPEYRDKAIRYGTQVIRFCNEKEWVERTHFALAWIYIHEKDFVSAREHIDVLPSVSSNRLQESIMAQITSIEYGTEEMKKVLRRNLQYFTRALNKEILYAANDLSWSDEPKSAIEFAMWGLNVMDALSQNEEMLPYCRGFFRDIYKAVLNADLRDNDFESAAKHFAELKKGMQRHYDYNQKVLKNDIESEKYPARQLRNMRAYTKDFIAEKQEEILKLLKEWHGEEKYQKLIKAIEDFSLNDN